MSVIIRKATMADILEGKNSEYVLGEYAKESSIKGMPTPTAKLDTYYHLENLGLLRVFCAFDDDSLVGFITILSTIMPHYSIVLSVAESFFVLKSHRKSGAGIKLLRLAEGVAREVGAPGLLVSAPYGGALAEVLPRCGYNPSNIAFFKAFKDV